MKTLFTIILVLFIGLPGFSQNNEDKKPIKIKPIKIPPPTAEDKAEAEKAKEYQYTHAYKKHPKYRCPKCKYETENPPKDGKCPKDGTKLKLVVFG